MVFVFFNKLYKKAFRVCYGLAFFFFLKLYHRIGKSYFQVIQIKSFSEICIFNVSATYYRRQGQYIFMGREYFKDIRYGGPASLFFGFASSLLDTVTFNRVETTLLEKSLVGFIRLEDPRVFVYDDKIYSICVCILKNSSSQDKHLLDARQILIQIEDFKVVNFTLFDTRKKIEKNWVVLTLHDSKAELLYSIMPFQKFTIPLTLSKQIHTINVDSNINLAFRNSTNFIRVGDYSYSIGHSIIDLGLVYVYLHFFIKQDDRNSTWKSIPFIFKNYGNEFATCLLEEDGKIIVLYSNHDKGNFHASYDSKDLEGLSWFRL